MIKDTDPRITVPPQAFLDAAIRNAHEERSVVLQQLLHWVSRSISALWTRQHRAAGPRATAGCS